MLDLAQSKDKEHSRYLCLRGATRKRHLKPSYPEWHREAVMNCHQDERQRRRRRLRWLPKSLGLLPPTIDAISRHRETLGSFSEEASLGCDGHVWRGSWLVQCAAYVVAGAIRGDGSDIRYMYICTVVGRRMSKGRLILDLKRGHQQCDI